MSRPPWMVPCWRLWPCPTCSACVPGARRSGRGSTPGTEGVPSGRRTATPRALRLTRARPRLLFPEVEVLGLGGPVAGCGGFLGAEDPPEHGQPPEVLAGPNRRWLPASHSSAAPPSCRPTLRPALPTVPTCATRVSTQHTSAFPACAMASPPADTAQPAQRPAKGSGEISPALQGVPSLARTGCPRPRRPAPRRMRWGSARSVRRRQAAAPRPTSATARAACRPAAPSPRPRQRLRRRRGSRLPCRACRAPGRSRVRH